VRGPPQRRHAPGDRRGSIPAGTGPTRPPARVGRPPGEHSHERRPDTTPGPETPCASRHPREHGGDDGQIVVLDLSLGISPRGQLPGLRGGHGQEGSIPASAGPTRIVRQYARCWRKCPRGCGADAAHVMTGATIWGASPRARGRRVGAAHLDHGLGPDSVCAMTSGSIPGASPRARSRHAADLGLGLSVGTIPASTGPI
jgi:hypothetical protein